MIVGLVLVLLAGLAGVLGHWLLYTQEGLQFALRQAARLPSVKIEVQGARGTLSGPLDFDRIDVDHEAVHIEARGLHVVSQVRQLMLGQVTLRDVRIERLSVRLKPRPPQPETPPHFLPAWLRIDVPGFRIGNVDLTLLGGERIVADAVTGSVAMTRWRINVDPLDIRGPSGEVAGRLGLRATEPLGLQTDLRGTWQLAGDTYAYRFRAVTAGKLDRLAADLFLDAPAKLSFEGTLLDLTETPRAQGTFRIVDFDGSPWVPAGRFPSMTGTISLAAGAKSLGLDGTFTSPSLPGQQVRLQGSAEFDERRIEIAGLRAWLPRLGLVFTSAGHVELAAPDAPPGTLPHLRLAGEWTALRWPLNLGAKATVASPEGVYTLEGSLPYRFTARAEANGEAIPAVTIDAAGLVDKDGVRLERFDGYALRGRVQGQGSLQWSGAQPWHFDVRAKSLAIGELRPGVDGRIDAVASIAGTGLNAAAPWTARVQSMTGTLFGRPLSGRGAIAHRDGVFELSDVRVMNGASHADVHGRFGATALDLNWDLDLVSLAIVARDMHGHLVSRGTARGTLQKPEVQGTAQLAGFAYGPITVMTLKAEANVDGSDRRTSNVALEADKVDGGVLKFDTVRAGLAGYLRDHTLSLKFSSPGDPDRRITAFDGALHASGALDFAKKTWAGNLDGAAVEFPEGAASRLIQPAALTVGPDLQRVAPLCLRTEEDARLCVEGEFHPRPQAWRVIYSAEDWPLKRLLSSVLGWREFDGMLQASGWAEKAPGKDWVGGSTVLVHDPSLDIPRNKFRSERIKFGSSRLEVYAEPAQIRATVDLEVDESTRMQGEAFVERHPGDPMSSPLRGHLSGASEAIKVVPLLIPEIDRAGGKLNGQLSLGGTLGQPTFTGDFHLREGRLELYRTNLIVSALQADGAFEGDELRLTAQGSTAKGKLAIDGKFRWPGGVMTGEMRMTGNELLVADTPEYRVIASPDVVLRAGPDGYRVEGQVVIPTARISPREITTSVGSSPDERIVGIDDLEQQDKGPSTSQRVTTRVQVVLGENVRVVAYGLKARLLGDVTVSTVPDDVPRGNGTIKVVEGEYKAFGQDVRITKGLLSYVNAPLDEPSLEITAERKIKDSDITVAVNVRGTLERPFISITSTPAMSNNEALSYLLTGRSIDTLQSGEAASVNQTAENLAVSGGGVLLGGLGSRIGLDEVTVEKTDTKSGTTDTSVVLGKAISPKLFVSYGVSIAEAINTIKLRYTLNDRWSVKAESGLEQSADVEFRIER